MSSAVLHWQRCNVDEGTDPIGFSSSRTSSVVSSHEYNLLQGYYRNMDYSEGEEAYHDEDSETDSVFIRSPSEELEQPEIQVLDLEAEPTLQSFNNNAKRSVSRRLKRFWDVDNFGFALFWFWRNFFFHWCL